mmetsp:Transcript_20049/g.41066  ORF Transcript_20049/g.41066 Transcript_20049/m.41066 type:complete len:88 (+) Transcript_20049:120-383(+)
MATTQTIDCYHAYCSLTPLTCTGKIKSIQKFLSGLTLNGNVRIKRTENLFAKSHARYTTRKSLVRITGQIVEFLFAVMPLLCSNFAT